MSYDVVIGGTCENYTYNLSGLFGDIIPGGINGLSGMTGKKASSVLDAALSEINKKSLSALEAYDAPNGWGDWKGATDFLKRIKRNCDAHTRHKVYVV